MKKNILFFTGLLGVLYVTLISDIDGAAHHGHGNITGSASGTVGHCQTSSCHGGNNPLNVVQLQVLDSSTLLPITNYNDSQTYIVSLSGDATGVSTSLPGFGFQASAVFSNHTQAGTFIVPAASSSSIHTYPCGAITIIEHSIVLSPSVRSTNKYNIQFYWKAPGPGSDSVKFYSLLNAVNGNGGSSGDYPDAAPIVTIYEHNDSASSVKTASLNANSFSVNPNPATGNPFISYNLSSDQSVSLQIYDMSGKIIAQLADNELQSAGLHSYQPVIPVQGLFFASLVTGNKVSTLRFIKL